MFLATSAAAQRGPRVRFSPCNASSPSQVFAFDGPGVARAAFHQGSGAALKCLDIAGFNLDSNASIFTWPCGQDGAGANERWLVAPASIASAQATHKCLRAGLTGALSPARAGDVLTTATCDAGDAAQALVFDAASGLIALRGAGLCADAGVARGVMLAPCDTWPYSGMAFCDRRQAR